MTDFVRFEPYGSRSDASIAAALRKAKDFPLDAKGPAAKVPAAAAYKMKSQTCFRLPDEVTLFVALFDVDLIEALGEEEDIVIVELAIDDEEADPAVLETAIRAALAEARAAGYRPCKVCRPLEAAPFAA